MKIRVQMRPGSLVLQVKRLPSPEEGCWEPPVMVLRVGGAAALAVLSQGRDEKGPASPGLCPRGPGPLLPDPLILKQRWNPLTQTQPAFC